MNPVTIAWIGLAAIGSWMFFRKPYDGPKFKLGDRVYFLVQVTQGYSRGQIQKITKLEYPTESGSRYAYDVACSPDPYMYPGAPIKLAIALTNVEQGYLIPDDK